jgi:GT2 family glycosyltransferase
MTTERLTAADLTVVIPTVGREILRESLASLAAGSCWPARVVVVDQGRRSEIAALVEAASANGLDVRWTPSTRTGRAAAVNDGVALAVTRFVAITDDDCLVDPEWIAAMSARLRRNPEAIVTGRVHSGGAGVISVVTDVTPRLQRRPAVRFDRLSGGNMGVARALITRLGGLDEDQCVRTAEDGEFAYRALRNGVSILYAPEVAVTHVGWRGDAQRATQYESYALSQGGFFGKYLRRGDLFIALRACVHLLRALRRWVVGVVRRDPERARNGRAYVSGLFPGLRAGWRSGSRG